MTESIRRLLAGGLFLLMAAAGLEAVEGIMPLSQVKAGMTGVGRTVFRGTKIEEFGVEVLGILPNASPRTNIILTRLKGQGLETSGVILGMSGSPVYIEGKLIGAVAYSFPFSKEPIAGLTPIEEMLDIPAAPVRPSAPSASAGAVRILNLEDFIRLNGSLLGAPAGPVDFEGRTLAPLGIPLVARGFSPAALDRTRPFLSRMGFYPVSAAQAPQTREKLVFPEAMLREGDPVAIPLVSGDLDLSAVGTVTRVDGNKVYAFGHPLYNLGAVDYAMAKAQVLTVIPSLQSSFKLAAPGVVVGRISQDRSSGAFGEIGRMPEFIPVSVRVQGSALENREYKLNVIDDAILGPFFLAQALVALFGSVERSIGNLTLSLDGDLILKAGQSVHLDDMFSGNLDRPVADLSSLVLSVAYFLLNNEFEAVDIQRLDLNIKAVDEPRVCSLEQALLDNYEPSPNEVMALKLVVRTFRGETLSQDLPLPVPTLPPGSEFELVVGDAATMVQLETGLYHNPSITPRNLAQLLRLLNNLRKNNRIYLKLLAARPGLFLRGEEMPSLPATMRSLFGSPRAATSATELSQSTLTDYQIPVDYVFKGSAVIPVKIKK
jgi:hypothetical protein